MTQPHAALAAVLLDLDRCMHGRHHGDRCIDCRSGTSLGNFHMTPGHVIGYDVHGESIVVPPHGCWGDPEAWRSRAHAETTALRDTVGSDGGHETP